MNDDRRRILEMIAKGTISVAEGEELLDALKAAPLATSSEAGAEKPWSSAQPRYLRVEVTEAGRSKPTVNVRVPLQLVRAGVKLTSLIPMEAQKQVSAALCDKGIELDWANLSPEALEELIESLAELTVDIDDTDGDRVRVFCE